VEADQLYWKQHKNTTNFTYRNFSLADSPRVRLTRTRVYLCRMFICTESRASMLLRPATKSIKFTLSLLRDSLPSRPLSFNHQIVKVGLSGNSGVRHPIQTRHCRKRYLPQRKLLLHILTVNHLAFCIEHSPI
jgi:hypothetical protein